jgi:hypothetical protein
LLPFYFQDRDSVSFLRWATWERRPRLRRLPLTPDGWRLTADGWRLTAPQTQTIQPTETSESIRKVNGPNGWIVPAMIYRILNGTWLKDTGPPTCKAFDTGVESKGFSYFFSTCSFDFPERGSWRKQQDLPDLMNEGHRLEGPDSCIRSGFLN